MNQTHHSSNLFQKAVEAFTKLPGIGQKTAIRLVLHLINTEEDAVMDFSKAIADMKQNIRFCSKCYNIADEEVCDICKNKSRNHQQICVVEHIRDVISIENTGTYSGVYHILGGLIAPLEGIGPDQLHIDRLVERCKEEEVTELIMALSPNIEGDTTVFYISKSLKNLPEIRLTSIARGVAFGSELEYIDEFTLGRAFQKRVPIENYIN